MKNTPSSRRNFLKTAGKAVLTATGSVLVRPLLPRIAPVLHASPDTTDLYVVDFGIAETGSN